MNTFLYSAPLCCVHEKDKATGQTHSRAALLTSCAGGRRNMPPPPASCQ